MTTPSNPAATGVSPDIGRWRTARRLLLVLAAAATFIAIFYTVENWRGRREWENRRRELEAKGEVLDWASYVPAPVPDGQNFFEAPKMREWFIKPPSAAYPHLANATNGPRPFSPGQQNQHKDVDLVLAEVRVVTEPAAPNPEGSEVVMRLDDPASRERAAMQVEEAVGPYLIGANGSIILLARASDQQKTARWVVQTDTSPSSSMLSLLFHPNSRRNLHGILESSAWGIEQVGKDLFHVVLKKPVYGAAEYLAWTDQLKPNFDLVRQALQRPYARIDCDYALPFAIDIPNFINLRTASQTLSMRAQSYLLMGQPEDALRELTLIHDLSQVLLVKPSGKPITLVGAMIHAAIQGLYAEMIREGLELHAWREPQLLALEQQLKESNLLVPLVQAFQEERAATTRTFESTKRSELINLFAFEGFTKLVLRWMPRGWFYQNMAVGAEMEQQVVTSLDPTNQLVQPQPVTEVINELASEREARSPYRFLVAVALPNYAKALQTAAGNQTLINQARIACALERFRLGQGRYPTSLDALTPGFIEKMPHDLIGGHPLKYRLNQAGGYFLYSIGWDEQDSGGVAGNSRDEGDWVWSMR